MFVVYWGVGVGGISWILFEIGGINVYFIGGGWMYVFMFWF